MPIFEFSCDTCEKRIEKILSFEESENYKNVCDCGKGTMRKVPISNCNFSLKGKWFKTTGSY